MAEYGKTIVRALSRANKGKLEEVTVQIDLDNFMLQKIATRAANNRTGKAVIGGGAVVAKVKNRKVIG